MFKICLFALAGESLLKIISNCSPAFGCADDDNLRVELIERDHIPPISGHMKID